MAKSRKKTARTATKKRSAQAKRTKVSRRTAASPTKNKKSSKPARKPPQRARRLKPAAPTKPATGTMQSVVDTAKEAMEMRDRMTARGPLGEG